MGQPRSCGYEGVGAWCDIRSLSPPMPGFLSVTVTARHLIERGTSGRDRSPKPLPSHFPLQSLLSPRFEKRGSCDETSYSGICPDGGHGFRFAEGLAAPIRARTSDDDDEGTDTIHGRTE
ncbi:hypothetical protein DPEC_G00004940 [Dallia pectoralis]|uniref:Uncharacterized protein n=1 Tax=Dallia pectoralis TaxID=75939 RepID=A0ACC2HKK8_DALPE|nr:hypothetical protein DPEC_G00004940 [Dallia pectoralis]